MNPTTPTTPTTNTPSAPRPRSSRSALHLSVGLCAALALALILLTGQRLDAQGAAGGRIAVADVEAVISKLAIQDAFQGEMNQRRVQIESEKKQREDAIEQLKARLQVVAAGSDQARQIENDVVLQTIQLEALLKFEQARFARDNALHFAKLYQDVMNAASRIATQNGYSVLLKKEPEPNLQKLAPKDLAQVFQSRKLLWNDGAVDLTQQIILQMNNEFNNP